MENDKISSNINPTLLEKGIKNNLEVKLNRLRHKNYNTDRRINDEDNNIRKQIKRAGKRFRLYTYKIVYMYIERKKHN